MKTMAHTKIVDGKRWADGSLSRYRVDELTYEMWSEILVEMGFKYKAPIFHKAPWVHSKDHKLQIRLEGLTVTIQLKGESYPISFDPAHNATGAVDALLRLIRSCY